MPAKMVRVHKIYLLILCTTLCSGNMNTVSVLGREEGYTVKYTPWPEGELYYSSVESLLQCSIELYYSSVESCITVQ